MELTKRFPASFVTIMFLAPRVREQQRGAKHEKPLGKSMAFIDAGKRKSDGYLNGCLLLFMYYLIKRKSSRAEFEEYCKTWEGRWIGDMTWIAAWYG